MIEKPDSGNKIKNLIEGISIKKVDSGKYGQKRINKIKIEYEQQFKLN
jgi:hypothetical protein